MLLDCILELWIFESKKVNLEFNQNVRETKVNTLNLKSNRLLVCKTENIFFQKKAGIAKLTKEGINKSLERIFPNQNIKNHDENLIDSIIDFENHFTTIENTYKKSLEKVILTNEKLSLEDRVDLSTFIVFQLFRSPFFLNKMIAEFENNEMEKFELLITFKNILSKKESLIKFIGQYLFSEWRIYKISKNIFPLSDNPIMIKDKNLMVALAPDILLELNLKKTEKNIENFIYKKRITYFKQHEFIKRTIKNSSIEIIFGNEEKLKNIQNSNAYKKHLLEI